MRQFKATHLMAELLLFWLRLGVAVVGFSTAIAWLVILRVVRTSKAYSRQSFARVMSRLTCPPLGISIRVSGREFIEQTRPCIYVANHQSYVDYPVAGRIFPGNAVVLARQVGDMPILGALFRGTGNITVDRDVPTRATVALDDAALAMSERNNSVWIFPEGTRGKHQGKLGPFKRGAFRLALATGAPIVPVVISSLKPNTDLRKRKLRRHVVDIRVLPAVHVASIPDADEATLRDHVHDLMQRSLDGASSSVVK